MTSRLKNNCINHPRKSILLKFSQIVAKRLKQEVTKLGSHSLSGFRVAADTMVVWDKNAPRPPPGNRVHLVELRRFSCHRIHHSQRVLASSQKNFQSSREWRQVNKGITIITKLTEHANVFFSTCPVVVLVIFLWGLFSLHKEPAILHHWNHPIGPPF